MLQQNVTVTVQGRKRAVVLTSTLAIKQLQNKSCQEYSSGDLCVIVDHLNGQPPVWNIYSHGCDGELTKVSEQSKRMILTKLHKDLILWLSGGLTKTFPPSLRPTKLTLDEVEHINNLKDIFYDNPIPTRLRNLLLDHRLNSDWYRSYFNNQSDIKILGKQVSSGLVMRKLPITGKPVAVTVSWLVYYSDQRVMYIESSSSAPKRSLDLKGAVQAISFTHCAHVADGLPWLRIKNYHSC